jgi:hypothetical protein
MTAACILNTKKTGALKKTEAGSVLQPQKRKGGGRRAALSIRLREVEVEVLSIRV